MKIKKVILQNFRCFKELEVSFSEKMTVFVAANGQGKTSVIEAVAYLLGVMLGRFPQVSVPRLKKSDFRMEWKRENELEQINSWRSVKYAPFMRVSGEAFSGERWDTTLKRDASSRTEARIPSAIGGKEILAVADRYIDQSNETSAPSECFPVFAYYDTSRAVIRKKPERRRNFKKVFNRFDGYREALEGRLNYKKMIEWLCYLEDKQWRERERVRDWEYQTIEQKTIQYAIEKMLPGFSNLRTHNRPLDLVIDFVDKQRGLVKSYCVDSQLSDGYKIVLVLVLDLVSRILELNSDILNVTPEKLLQVSGIVLIDEIDLHLHPSWQQRILGDMQRTFPNLQFIVTTHSPQVISSIPMECVRVITDGEILNSSIKTDGARADQILSEVFGVTARYEKSEITKDLIDFQSLIAQNQWDSARGDLLWKRLNTTLSTDPILAKLAMRIHLKKQQRNSNEKN